MARSKKRRRAPVPRPRVVGLMAGEGYSCHGPVDPGSEDLKDLRRASKAIRGSGLKIPEMRVTFWRSIICDGVGCSGLCVGKEGEPYKIMLEYSSSWAQTLVHEVAHAVADAVTRPGLPDHSQVWAAIYGLLYQVVIQR